MATLTRAGLADALHREVGLPRSETAGFVEDGGAGVRAGRRQGRRIAEQIGMDLLRRWGAG